MELHKMICVEIDSKNSYLLKEFIEKNYNKGFRYYDSRSFDCIENHLLTNLYYEDGQCVGYGHLDIEGRIWLGIMVAEGLRGKGYGSLIMDDLISNSTEEIYLTVDKSNPAKNLYTKKGFEVLEEKENHFLMIRKNK